MSHFTWNERQKFACWRICKSNLGDYESLDSLVLLHVHFCVIYVENECWLAEMRRWNKVQVSRMSKEFFAFKSDFFLMCWIFNENSLIFAHTNMGAAEGAIFTFGLWSKRRTSVLPCSTEVKQTTTFYHFISGRPKTTWLNWFCTVKLCTHSRDINKIQNKYAKRLCSCW